MDAEAQTDTVWEDECDEVNQVLTTSVWLEHEWTDERLFWDPKDYNGLQMLRVPCNRLWLPDIVLYNDANDFTSGYMQSRAMVTSNGSVFWAPPAKLRSTCKIDITFFPFDDQICRMKFGSWTYDGYQVNMTKKGNEVDLSHYVESGEWNLLRVEIHRNEVRYPCCDEPYPDVTFVVVIRRRILYYIFNIVFPCLWLTVLSLLCFWLPPDSGEKITLGITVLLSFSVFMLLVAEQMPATSEFVPLIGIYLTVTMATTSLSIGLTVCVLHLYHSGPAPRRVPRFTRRLFFGALARWMRIPTEPGSKPSYTRPRSSFGGEALGQETPLGTFLRQCQPLLRHYKYMPPPEPTEGHNGGLHSPPSPLLTKVSQEGDVELLDESVLLPDLWDEEEDVEARRPRSKRGASRRRQKHQQSLQLYEQIAKHLRSLIKRQEEEEADQEIINEWRVLAYILDRCLFYFFCFICTLSSVVLLCVMPLFKPNFSSDNDR